MPVLLTTVLTARTQGAADEHDKVRTWLLRGVRARPLRVGAASCAACRRGWRGHRDGGTATFVGVPAAPVDRVLVLLSMRGPATGSTAVPHGTPPTAARPSIQVPPTRLLAKDGFFGLHPALAPRGG
jgi:hypothetical protein